jgi:hypothetical protein
MDPWVPPGITQFLVAIDRLFSASAALQPCPSARPGVQAARAPGRRGITLSAPGDESVATLYGLPVFDASTGEDSASSDASRDASPEAGLLDASAPDVGVVALYGAPPLDASVDARMITPPYGSPAPLYGAPGFFDDDGGTSRD